MEYHGEDYVSSSSKFLGAQSHIWNHLFSFINSMSLKCAIDLGIPDAIHNYGQPIPLSKLISHLQINPNKTHYIRRLMRILTHSGFFSQKNNQTEDDEQEEVRYVLTDASRLLLKDHPFCMIPFCNVIVDPILVNPWYQFPNWFKNDDDDTTPFKIEHGMTFWEYVGNVPKLGNVFNDAMSSDSGLVSSVVVEKCEGVFKGLGSLVDVGGGRGTMAKAIAKSFPQIECIVFDLPHVVAGLQERENLKYVAGDMFDKIPPAQAILLKWILHDWNDDECVKILKKCKEAITRNKEKEGKVIIIDMVLMWNNKNGDNDDDKSIESQLFFDMLMMSILSGKERNEKEWAKLIFSAGFSDYKITSILGSRSLIEIYP